MRLEIMRTPGVVPPATGADDKDTDESRGAADAVHDGAASKIVEGRV